MAIWQVDGATPREDVRAQRIAAGTVGGEHAVPGSFSARQMSNVISPFDTRITYGGSWTFGAQQSSEDYLGRSVQISIPGAFIQLPFTGTSLSIIGLNTLAGGRADVYIDGVLQGGRVNTYTSLDVTAYVIVGLNATDTTITVADTSAFASSGTIIIDSEVITYSGKTSTTFTGCTRSGSATHIAAAMVYAYSSTVNFYSPYHQSRTTVWSNNALQPGQHTLDLVVRSDKDASSTNTSVNIGGFIAGGMIGANNILTSLDYIKYTGVTFGASGVSTAVALPINQATTNQQILGVLGAMAYAGATAKPCFVSYEAQSGTFALYCPTGTSSTLDVVITLMVLAASI